MGFGGDPWRRNPEKKHLDGNWIQPEWILVPNSSGTHASHPNLESF